MQSPLKNYTIARDQERERKLNQREELAITQNKDSQFRNQNAREMVSKRFTEAT